MTMTTRTLFAAALMGASLAACSTTDIVLPPMDAPPPHQDTRAGLAPGLYDAGEANWNLTLVQSLPQPEGFVDSEGQWSPQIEMALAKDMEDGKDVPRPPKGISFANSDLAFGKDMVVMGNFHGFNVYKVGSNSKLKHALSVACPGGQGDVSIHGNLVFFSTEQRRGRLDCGGGGVEGESSAERFIGVRIFDISDLSAPRQVAAVQTCRGSHTHTLVPHPTDPGILYVYNSGTSAVRPSSELAGCSDGDPGDNPDTALYSIDVIEVPLDAPQNARVVNSPRVFADRDSGKVDGLWEGGEMTEDAQTTAATVACHDILAYPEFALAAGACGGNGILLDISDPVNPRRIDEVSDPNMAYWHSANFNNDATKLLFADEWGGGIAARCQADDPPEWGADIIYDRTESGLEKRGMFKIPTVQTAQENCVSHNGQLIPVPGRDILVQGWYSGGISVIDFTDSEHPIEIAYFDRGPVSAENLYLAGHWAAYWHNGRIYAPEIARGLDVLELVPSDYLTANEIAAAELITYDEANTQTQVMANWPAEPVVARAYVDQLWRTDAIDEALAKDVLSAVAEWDAGRWDAQLMTDLAEALGGAAERSEGKTAERYAALAEILGEAR
ncbi:hypothetical protein [Parvularcula sp. LCG005]|uniref:LVIVD repeat-containing protein n=1 Tax=Parvularcula sp. LCG005 TaxID=3078805 RepID=UPI002943A9FA|nr:hypothetical protein [Parvularcula sp. LCG005]WOI52476.1 hypothetical protein RUI03_09990 [Parvularcula sp. LCG005]